MAMQCESCKVDMVKKMQKIGTDGTPVWKWVCPKCGREETDGGDDNSRNSDDTIGRAEAL